MLQCSKVASVVTRALSYRPCSSEFKSFSTCIVLYLETDINQWLSAGLGATCAVAMGNCTEEVHSVKKCFNRKLWETSKSNIFSGNGRNDKIKQFPQALEMPKLKFSRAWISEILTL